MSGLPKKYIKKYGVSKKAWSEYRKSKGRTTRTQKTKRGGVKVARRKRSYSRARSGLKSMFGMSSLQTVLKAAIAGGVTGAVQNAIPDDALGGYGDVLVPIVVGMVTKNQTLQTIGGYQLGAKFASGLTGTAGTTNAW